MGAGEGAARSLGAATAIKLVVSETSMIAGTGAERVAALCPVMDRRMWNARRIVEL
jgi:hypothetical protein